jgi:hypothetical protein
MITFEYAVEQNVKGIDQLADRFNVGTRQTMQTVLDTLVANIQGKFSDAALARTVTSFIVNEGKLGSDSYVIEGQVTSTWANMIWYEKGRRAGGKMPPQDAILSYMARHGITPDPDKARLAFAFAINVARQRDGKHRVPIDALVEWQNRAGVVVPNDFALNSVAYAIGKKIVREGIPGRHFFAQGLAETMPFINSSFESVVVTATGI